MMSPPSKMVISLEKERFWGDFIAALKLMLGSDIRHFCSHPMTKANHCDHTKLKEHKEVQSTSKKRSRNSTNNCYQQHWGEEQEFNFRHVQFEVPSNYPK